MMTRHTVSFAFLCMALLCGFTTSRSEAAEVVVVGDTQFKPVIDIILGIRKTLRASIRIYTPGEAKGLLNRIVEQENAKVVVALGKEALAEALNLPPAIPVIYDLIVIPPKISRPNTTGFYMATPVREYINLINNHLHTFKQITVVGSSDQLSILAQEKTAQMNIQSVSSSFELVNAVKQLDDTSAILLLPDSSLLTTSAMNEAYLLSFRKAIPLFGISERHVKEGALLALVVDMVNVGKLIGEAASKSIKGMNIGQLPPSPPRKFDFYLNTATARKMGIPISDEMVRMAKRVYP